MKTPITRKAFLKTGLAGVLAGGIAPRFISSRLLGQAAPSKRVSIGCIGLGIHGLQVNMNAFLQEDDCVVRAVCDVFASRRKKAKEIVDTHYGTKDCLVFEDFRELLARPDIDAVVISTPDHWHVTMSLMALDAGKMVFCEKPTLTIEEGRRLADAVKKRGAVFATGLEDRSKVHYHKIAEVVRNGAIGRLRHITVGLPQHSVIAKEAPAPVPADLNYELWLGPAAFRPFTPRLTNANVWRQIREFSGGTLTDWGAHLVDTAQVVNFSENSSPVRVEGTATIPPDAMNSVPLRYKLSYVYANGVTLDVASHPNRRFIRVEGTEGWVGTKEFSGPFEASDMDILRRTFDPASNKMWPRPPREHRDFLDSIKSGKPPTYTAEALHRLSTALHIGAISLELGRPLRWDPETEAFVGDAAAEANALRSRAQRDDWKRA